QTAQVAPGAKELRKAGVVRIQEWFVAIESAGSEVELVNRVAQQNLSAEETAEAKAVVAGVQALARVEAPQYLVNGVRSIAAGSGEFAPRANQILEKLAH